VGCGKTKFNCIRQVAPLGYISATWQIQLNLPSEAAVQHYAKLLLTTCHFCNSYIHSVPEKNNHFVFLVITSANINRFSKFFHWQIPRKLTWVALMAISTSPYLCCYTTLWNSKIHNNCQTITPTGKINLVYTKLSKVHKVQNMLINMWTNAVMFRVNVQNVLCRLLRRLSVACAIHWSRC